MCENIFRFLNNLYKIPYIVPTFISLIFLIFLSLFMHFRKMGKIHSEWKRKDKLLSFIEEKANILIYIILTIVFFLFFNFIFLSSNIDVIRKKIIESYGLIFSTFITVFGVFAGFVFNKRQTYKEIVTRERIDWLRDLKNNFSEYLALTSYGYVRYNDIDRVRELYNKIIFNINSVNDIEALEAIKNYDDFVFGKKVEASKEIEKYSDRINCTGAKEEIYYYDIYVSDYEFLKNNMEEKFRAIFKGTWTFIKREAD